VGLDVREYRVTRKGTPKLFAFRNVASTPGAGCNRSLTSTLAPVAVVLSDINEDGLGLYTRMPRRAKHTPPPWLSIYSIPGLGGN
jgi:hypothetical protein